MENVTVELDLMLVDEDTIFGDGWDFKIGIYDFKKLTERRVRITFTYQDEVTRYDPEDNVTEIGLDSYSERYIEVEEDLQTLLDIIAYQKSGVGIRLVPGSRIMKSRSISDNRTEHTRTASIRDIREIKDRYERTIKDRDEKLIDALRLNRLAANEENNGEKIGLLWAAVERLYADDPAKVLNTKDKRTEIGALIDSATLISIEDKTRLKNTASNTHAASKPSIIAEKFGLIGGDGKAMTVQEVKEELDYWISTRSIQSHGQVLARNENVNMLAGQMDHIIDTALGGIIRPAKYIYVVFRATNVTKSFADSHKATKKYDRLSRYSYYPIHKFAVFEDIQDRLRYGLKTDRSEMYLVDYKKVIMIKRQKDTAITFKSVKNPSLRKLLKNLKSKLNKRP
ncbi:MAG: hypothetical protein WAO28_04560 [Candidatus Microsaccharimonas sp.]